MAFTAVLCFGACSALAGMGAKCRLLAVGRRTSGGKLAGSIGIWPTALDGLEGMKKPAQVVPERALVVFKIFSPSPR